MAKKPNTKTPENSVRYVNRGAGVAAPPTKRKNSPQKSGAKQHPVKKKSNNLIVLIILAVFALVKRFFKAIGRGLYSVASRLGGFVLRLDLSYFGEYAYVAITALTLAAVIGLVALVWGFTNKNAYEILLNGEPVGIIRENKNWDAQSFTAAVTGIITNDVGSKVRPLGEVSFNHIHASRGSFETEDAVKAKLVSMLDFEAELISITLAGVEIAVLSNDEDCAALKDRLFAPYRKEDMVIIEEGFVEDLQFTPKYTSIEERTTVADAYDKLSDTYKTDIIHVVKRGETLGSVAGLYSTTVEAILENNGLTIDKPLQINQELKIAAERPLISVITVEERKYSKVVEYDTIPQVNTSRPAGYSAVLVRGVNGEAEVTEHITYINGVYQEGKIMKEDIITPPVTEIVEVGQG